MKRFNIALGAIALCGAAFAAPIDIVTVRFNQPVMIGEKTLPAGEIRFSVLHGSSSILMTARAESGEAAVVVLNRLHESEEPGHTSVILSRSGDTLKLERLWLDDGSGFAVAGAQ
jgi:hypothetical protein